MGQAERPKLEDNNVPEQKRAGKRETGILILALCVAFLYTNYDRGLIVVESGEGGYCRGVRQQVSELCAGADRRKVLPNARTMTTSPGKY